MKPTISTRQVMAGLVVVMSGWTVPVFAQVPAATPPAAPAASGQPRGLTLAPGIDLPLSTDLADGNDSQGTQLAGSTRMQLTLRFAPRDTWFVRITGYYYFNGDTKRPWNPDFTYSFGYDNWRPGTFALTYDNYGGNRLSPDAVRGEQVTWFEEGTITASYKIPMPQGLETLFAEDGERRWTASVGAHVMPRFRQLGSAERGTWKRSLSVGVRSRFYRRLYVEGRAFVYPSSHQQQPWDPDFTYGFGWFDWRPGTLSLQYGNYSGNRWPGRTAAGNGRFRNGSLTLHYTATW